jgi:hypothetical protein
MDEGLKIRIGADVSGLEKGINQATTSLNKLKPSVNQTGFALSNLSRIAQDAPFGFIAIQNNLDPLIQSFQQLKTQSGGTGNALKALAAGLAGPAGIALGFSVVASLATTLIQKYGSLGKAFEALANSGNSLYKSQQQLLGIQKDAAKNAGEDIARLNVLASVSADVTNSLGNRKEAANELLKVYKEYLPNLTQEALLNNQAADAINKAKDAILNKALAAAAEKKLAEIGAKVLDNQLAQVDAVEKYGRASKNFREQATKASKQELQGREGVNTATVAYQTELDKTKTKLQELGTESIGLQKEYDKLLKLATGFAKKTGDAFIADPKTSVAKISIKTPELRIVPESIKLDNSQFNADSEIARNFSRDNGFNVPVNLTIPQSAFDALRAFGESQYWKQIGEKTQGIINQFDNFLTPVINTAFEALGNGTNIIKAIGQSMKALVLQIGLTIAKAAILSAILNTIFPGGAAIGGSAVKGFGGIFKALLGIGQTAAPNFGGISGGGLAITVGGEFSMRGTTAVALVNAGSQTIRRVG